MVLLARALSAAAARLQSLSMSVECLKYSQSSSQACLLPESERDAIYQDSLSNNYTGVVEYLLIINNSSRSSVSQGTNFGLHSRSTHSLLLHEMYKTSFQGAGNFIQLNAFGDVRSDFEIVNYQSVRSESNTTSNPLAAWKKVGVASVNGGNVVSLRNASLVLHFAGSSYATPVIDSSIFIIPPEPDNCDFADKSEYSLFENFQHAFDSHKAGLIMILILAFLITCSFIVGVAYAVMILRREKEKAVGDNYSKGKTCYYSYISSKTNNAIVVMITIEYVYILFISLQPNLSWLNSEGTDNIVKSLVNLSFGSILFFLNYIWIFVLFFWCVYAVIYICHLSRRISKWYLGEMFLYPSIFYLRVVGTIGVLPIVTSLLRLFNCAYIDPLSTAVLVRPYCEHECFSTSHYVLVILAGVVLSVFIPLSLVTGHIWQELTIMKLKTKERFLKFKRRKRDDSSQNKNDSSALCVVFSRDYILVSQTFFLAIVGCIAFLKIFPITFLFIVITLLVARCLIHHFMLTNAVNVIWINSVVHFQVVAGVGSSLVCLITEFLQVSSFWPFGVIVMWGLSVALVWYKVNLRRYRQVGCSFYTDDISGVRDAEENQRIALENRTSEARLSYLVTQIHPSPAKTEENGSVDEQILKGWSSDELNIVRDFF